jgi:iron complex outermembrane recepter protein
VVVSVLESRAASPSSRFRRIRRISIVLLLAGIALPAHAGSAINAAEAAQAAPGEPRGPDIIVIAPPWFRDVPPERYLDETAIESYGVSTIDDLIAEVEGELADEDEPVFIVNGERVYDLENIGAYPIEVLRRLEVLPRGSAVRVGGRTGQRVINLTLKDQVRSATVTVAPRFATEGDWHAVRGETLFTYIRGDTRANLGLRVRDESRLLESDRGIIQPNPRLPFATQGNVIGFPGFGGEIDPLLSALAGELVTVAPIPPGSSPTLTQFAAGANLANTTDLGPFRTLRPDSRNYDINASYSTKLAPWLRSGATVRFNRLTSRSLLGLPSAELVLDAANPFSPFSTTVGLAAFGQDPLRRRFLREAVEGKLTFNAVFGHWRADVNAGYVEWTNRSSIERVTQTRQIFLGNSVNPFGIDLGELIPLTTHHASTRSRTALTEANVFGPAFELPAGDVRASVRGRLAWHSLRGSSDFGGTGTVRTFDRTEQSLLGALEIPLTSRRRDFVPELGELSASTQYGRSHFSDSGSLDEYGFALTWEPRPPVRLRASVDRTAAPPAMDILGEPLVVMPNVRFFDPLTGETVDVTQVTGAADIRPERMTTKRLSGILRLVPSIRLNLNADYTDIDRRRFIASLPEASLPIMLAFPGRFVRDEDGVLTLVDLRPVNFLSHHEKRFRYGLSLNAPLGGGAPALRRATEPDTGTIIAGDEPAEDAPPPAASGPRTRLILTANHALVLSDKIFIRPGLDPVNLLEGGAIGIASGRVRHQLDGSAGITSGGLGARLAVRWRGKSTLDTRIGEMEDTLTFSPLLTINLRAFVDARRLFPNSDWARGTRASLSVVNLTNQRQRVRDPLGNTPLQYQPGYRDPLGRTIEFEIRRMFR